MRHLPYMHTPVRLGVTDGAIDVTSAAVGKVSDRRRGYSGRGASLSALPPKEGIFFGACPLSANSGHIEGSQGYDRAARDGGHGKFCGKITE